MVSRQRTRPTTIQRLHALFETMKLSRAASLLALSLVFVPRADASIGWRGRSLQDTTSAAATDVRMLRSSPTTLFRYS